MAEDEPPDPRAEAKRKAHAEKYGIPLDRVTYIRFDPWAWAAARGLKPLPGREIPPEYRHLFENPGGAGAEETKGPAPPALDSTPSQLAAPAETPRSEAPPSEAEERVYRSLVRQASIRRALSRDDLPEQ